MEGRTDDALILLTQGMELARQRGAQEVLGWLLCYTTLACLDAGDLARARRHAQESLELARRVDNPQNYVQACWSMNLTLMRTGETDAAAAFAEEWLQLAPKVTAMSAPWARSVLAELRGRQGEYTLAVALAQQALADADSQALPIGRIWTLFALARITFGRGVEVHLSDAELAQVEDWLQQAEQAIDSTGYRARLPELQELRSELARRRAAVV